MVRVQKCMFFLGPKSRFLVQKFNFCYTTPILVNDPCLPLFRYFFLHYIFILTYNNHCCYYYHTLFIINIIIFIVSSFYLVSSTLFPPSPVKHNFLKDSKIQSQLLYKSRGSCARQVTITAPVCHCQSLDNIVYREGGPRVKAFETINSQI